MPHKRQDTVQAYNKDGSPKFIVDAHGTRPARIPVTREYRVVYVQDTTTGEVTEQSEKAAAMFYRGGKYRFLKTADGARLMAEQRAARGLRPDDGRLDFAALEVSADTAPETETDDDDETDEAPKVDQKPKPKPAARSVKADKPAEGKADKPAEGSGE